MSLAQRFAQIFGVIYLLVGILLRACGAAARAGGAGGHRASRRLPAWPVRCQLAAQPDAPGNRGGRAGALQKPRRGAVLRAGDRGALPDALLAGARPAHRIWSRAALRGAGPAATPGHGDDRLRSLLHFASSQGTAEKAI